MKKKILLSLLCGVMVLGISTGCGKNKEEGTNSSTNNNGDNSSTNNSNVESGKLFNIPYFGDITVGSVTFNMASTDEEIENKGMDKKRGIYKYEDENSGSYIYYEVKDSEDDLSINFETHNSLYKDLGCEDCDNAMSTYVKLPKNITYDSTMNDVINAYGKPTQNDLDNDDGYNAEENGYKSIDEGYEHEENSLTGEELGEIECYKLRYSAGNNNTEKFNLNLYFNKDTQKLYKIEYELDIDK